MNTHKSSGYYLVSDGILTLIAGIVLLFFTGISQLSLVYLFSAYAVVYGIAQLFAARGEREPEQSPVAFWLIGGFSVLAGLGLLLFRDSSLSTIITYVAGYAIVVGAGEALTAYLYQDIHGWGWLASLGVFQAIFGVVLFAFTGMALSTFIMTVALYAIAEGAFTVAYGYQLSQVTHQTGIPQHMN